MSPSTGITEKRSLQSGQPSNTNPGIYLRPSLPAGYLPTAIVAGDFNGDGKPDWVVANGGDNCLFVYLGNGDGTSQLPVIIPLVGSSPIALATGDLNGDGNLDLVVVEADSQTVGIFLGNGNGTFGTEIELSPLSTTPLSVAIADVNKDGKPDLVVGVAGVIGSAAPGPFVTMLGDGAGHFGGAIPAPNGSGLTFQNGVAVSVTDVNGDGFPDVLSTGDVGAGGSSQIFIGKGDGTFTAGQTLYTLSGLAGDFVENGILADVTGDGCPDAVVGDSVSAVHVFPGNCKGQFDTTANFQVYGMGDPIVGMAVADLNGDGHPDLIIGGFPNQVPAGGGPMAGNLVGVRLSDGSGHFGPLKVYAGEPGMFSVVAADLKGNSRPDILTANQNTNSITVYQNDGSAGFGSPQGGYFGNLNGSGPWPANPGITDYLVADVDGNGLPDILQLQLPPQGISNLYNLAVMLNQGNGNFSQPVHTNLFDTLTLIADFVAADFRNTGKLDFLALVNNGSVPEFAFAPYQGNGQYGTVSFSSLPTLPYGVSISGIGVGDFNRDGKLDFAVVTAMGNSFTVLMYLGNGDGTFRQTSQSLAGPANSPPSNSGLPILVEDANKDGQLDLLVWFGALVEFLGNGDGTFQSPTIPIANVPELTAADLNHDGLLDIVQQTADTPPAPTTVSIYLGKADGTFSAPTTYSPYTGIQTGFFGDVYHSSWSLFGQLVGDFHGDGSADVAVFQIPAPTENPYIQFMRGNGDGTFTPTYDVFPLGETTIPVLAVPNLMGDQSTSFLFEDNIGAAFLILPSAPAPSFQLAMDETPIVGSTGAFHIGLNIATSSAVTFQISASDPAIQVPTTTTIPGGQLSTDVPFTIASGFDPLKQFSITASLGSEAYTLYDYVAPPGANSAFQASLVDPTVFTPAGGTTGSLDILVFSLGDATGTFQFAGCLDLPATATCNFPSNSFQTTPQQRGYSSFTISTTSQIPVGTYPFRVQITDGSQTLDASGTLNVGDFSLSLQPGSLSIPSYSTVANFSYTLVSNNYNGVVVDLSCSNLPAGAACLANQATVGTSGTFAVALNQTPPGDYTFTVTATSTNGSDTHSASAQLQLLAVPNPVINPTQVLFPLILVGTTTNSNQITLQNLGSGVLNIRGIAATANQGASGTFAEADNCGSSLAVNSSCTLNITFAANSVGSATGNVQLTDNGSNSPQAISLSAAAGDFSIAAANGGSTSATITAGQSAIYNLQVQPNQFQGTIQLSCSGAPSSSICSMTPNPLSVASSGPAAFQVQVATSPRNGSVHPGSRFRFDGRPFDLMRIVVGLLLILLAFWLQKTRQSWRKASVAMLIAFTIILLGCGGGSGASGGTSQGGGGGGGTPAGTYTLTITGQAAGGSRTISLQLSVN